MTEQSFLQVRVDSKLKQDATVILDAIGMDMPNAIRMFLKRIVIEQGLPFDARLPQTVCEDTTSPVPTVITIPAKESLLLSEEEYLQTLCQVPAGKITRAVDIEAYLAKKHGVERVTIDHAPVTGMADAPRWREVSTRGMLMDVSHFFTKEQQREYLESEGLTIVHGGAHKKSLVVANYKEFLFSFDGEVER